MEISGALARANPVDESKQPGSVGLPPIDRSARPILVDDLIQQCKQLLRQGKVSEFNQLRPVGDLDLRGINLSHLNLSKVDFRSVDLSGAILEGVDLSEALLQSSKFERANLNAAILRDIKAFRSNFSRASLQNVREAHGAQFHESNLVGADLQNGKFDGAHFTQSKLIGAFLVSSSFKSCDFDSALMMGAILSQADFEGANLRRSRLFQSNGQDINFSKANLVEVDARQSYFTSSDESERGDQTKKTRFDGAWIKGLRHDGCIRSSLLSDAISESLPAEGAFKLSPKPSNEKLLVHGIPGSDRVRFEQALQQLDEMIGLKSVKSWVRSLTDFLIVKLARERAQLPDLEQTLHQVYLGNPGTGKTTVARIVSEVLASLGCLKKGHLIETDKAGLIAGYQGQTVGKTTKLVDSSLDGTLLIDEFYALLQDKNDSYAKDAVAILTKRLEDDRHKFCCIACGYTKPTMEVLEANPGMKSRFSQFVTFPDYTYGELVDIFKLLLRKKQFSVSQELLAAASMLICASKKKEGENFGNGRTVRTIVEKMYKGAMATRLVRESKLNDREALRTPLTQDLPFEEVGIARGSFPALEKLRWKGPNNSDLKMNELRLDGDFPELTDESIKIIHDALRDAKPITTEGSKQIK